MAGLPSAVTIQPQQVPKVITIGFRDNTGTRVSVHYRGSNSVVQSIVPVKTLEEQVRIVVIVIRSKYLCPATTSQTTPQPDPLQSGLASIPPCSSDLP